MLICKAFAPFLGVQVYPVGAVCVLENPPKLATASTTCKDILYPFYATL